MNRLSAFTLVEMLVFLGILLIISGFAVVLSLPQLAAIKGEGSVKELSSAIFTQQQSAFSGLSGKAYGIRFNTNSYDLFVGESWAARESSENFTITTGGEITAISLNNGSSEIVFATESFFPNTDGEIIVTEGSQQFAVLVNNQGLIDYEKR